MVFEVRTRKKVDTILAKLDRSGQKGAVKRIVRGFAQLSIDPYRPRPGADILKLESIDPHLYRLKVGDYRVLYSIARTEKIVKVTTILHRKRAYRRR